MNDSQHLPPDRSPTAINSATTNVMVESAPIPNFAITDFGPFVGNFVQIFDNAKNKMLLSLNSEVVLRVVIGAKLTSFTNKGEPVILKQVIVEREDGSIASEVTA